MNTKLIVAMLAALVGTTVGTVWAYPTLSAKLKGCCYEGSPCCFEGSPCCEAAKPCCYEGSPCCEAGLPCCLGFDCCYEGSPCCFEGSPCCGDAATQVSEVISVKPKAKAKKGCCAVGEACCESGEACRAK